MMRAMIHVDMDAFFASVEQLDDPSLLGKPVLVGGDSDRGVVAAASYEAREFGVRSAMPMIQARRQCPEAAIIRPRLARYAEVSRQVFAIFHSYTPLVQGLSLDEAFLDVTNSRSLFGDGVQIAKRIRADIWQDVHLTASAGVASSKFVAKVASDLDKPNGLTVVPYGDEAPFLAELPIKRMWGVGPKAQQKLQAFGMHTIGDLANADPETLTRLLGSWGEMVHELARGIDDRPVVVDRPAKSIGAEHTFERDLKTIDELKKPILSQSIRVADRLVHAELRAMSITLKVKYGDHQLCSRQLTLPEAVSDPDSIYEASCRLLAKVPDLHRGVRLTGVSVSRFDTAVQSVLFADPDLEKRDRLEALSASLRSRFGNSAMTRARLVEVNTNKKRER